MAMFNQTKRPTDLTRNAEGAIAYKLPAELEFFSRACIVRDSDGFYQTMDQATTRLAEMISKREVTPEFAMKTALMVRDKYHIRRTPLFILVQLAINRTLRASAVEKVISRVDEMPELLAGYAHLAPVYSGGKRGTKLSSGQVKQLNKLSMALKKGIGRAFWKFDEYQLAKYDRSGKEVTLKDVVFVTHPLARLSHRTPQQIDLVNRLINGQLNVPDTWEVALSAAGSDPAAKRAEWERLILEKNAKGYYKLGYMALMRNLRNMIQAGVDPAIMRDHVAARLADPQSVKFSKQLPFRFFTAYREIKPVLRSNPAYKILGVALNDAAVQSIFNVPGLDSINNVLVASDVSGSMNHPLTKKSSLEYWDLGLILGFLLREATRSDIGIFGTEFKMIKPSHEMILDNIIEGQRLSNQVGWSTNGHKVVEFALQNQKKYDHVMLFTDCQLWDSNGYGYGGWGYNQDRHDRKGNPESPMQHAWKQYRQFNPNAKLYLFNLSDYGDSPVRLSTNGASMICGWSDHIFQVLSDMQRGKNFIDEINAVEI